MKADLTRNTFRYWKHITRVLMQQGRVQLEADWNEQAAILLHYLRSSAADIIGPYGRPAANSGFDLRPLNLLQPTPGDFALSAGHFFVSGILCENTPDPIVIYPLSPINPALTTLKVAAETLAAQGRFLQIDEVLEIFDAANPLSYVFGVVSARDPASRSLTLSIASIPNWIGDNAARPCVRRALTYTKQPDFPMPKTDLIGPNTTLIYLDVWERLVTYVDDDTIRDVALGGPDTAARAKLVCQVKSLSAKVLSTKPDKEDLVSFLQDKFQPHNRGYLRARVKPSVSDSDPCIISPTSRYRGPENQLYRVEIHTGGSLGAVIPTFKWSRENGSVIFPIVSGGGTNVVTLESLGRDDRYGLAEGDWVEVVDDDYVLLNRAGTLLQVQSIDRSAIRVTLLGTPDNNVGNDPTKHPMLRRWDQQQGDETDGELTLGPDNAAKIKEGSGDDAWLNLEDGVQVQFEQFDKGQVAPQYRTGDYWLIPARTATGDVEWPTEILKDSLGSSKKWVIALPPDGINHYYAPLGTLTLDDASNIVQGNISSPVSFTPLGHRFS